MKNKILLISSILLILLSIFMLLPSPIDSVAWTPQKAPSLTNQYAKNSSLQQSKLLAKGHIQGPEDVAIDAQGRVYGGTENGIIKRIKENGEIEDWANTYGRPLGLAFDHRQNLIVADAFKGLLSISKEGQITTLLQEVNHIPLGFSNDVDIAKDGKIYFTDASTKWDQKHFTEDLLETRPYGRLVVFDPASRSARVLLDKLYFANGVALSQNEDFLLINETWRYRIIRYWLKGERKGTHDIFIDNLPGFPDGVSSNRRGIFWVALPTPRIASVDNMYPHPWLKNLVAKLPAFLKPKPIKYGLVLGLNEHGQVIYNLQDPSGEVVHEITSVEQYQQQLYLGTLHNDTIGVFPLNIIKQN